MSDNETKSILDTQIDFSGIIKGKTITDYSQYAAFMAIFIFLVSPILISIPAMIIRRMDYQVLYHYLFIHRIIYPASAAFAFVSLILALIVRGRNRKGVKSFIRDNTPIVLFVLTFMLMLISLSQNWRENALILTVPPTRGESFVMQAANLVLLFPAASLLRSSRLKLLLFRLFEVASWFLVLAAFILQDQEKSSLYDGMCYGFESIYVNTNFYGYVLSLSVPLAAALYVAEKNRSWEVFSFITLVLNTVALVINNTMGAWIACIFAAVFMIVVHKIVDKKISRKVMISISVFVLTLIITGVITGKLQYNFLRLFGDLGIIAAGENIDSIGSSRGYIWKWTIRFIKENPLFGIGFEGVAFEPFVETTKNFRPHNEYLQYALFYGIPAGICYFLGCFSVFLRGLLYKDEISDMSLVALTSAFGYLVSAFFGLTVYCIAPLMFLMLGMGMHRETDK